MKVGGLRLPGRSSGSTAEVELDPMLSGLSSELW